MTDGEQALQRIEYHERLCAERFAGIKASVDRIERVLITMAGTIIVQLLTACAYMAMHWPSTNH